MSDHESSGDDFVNGNGSPVVSESDSDSSSDSDDQIKTKRKANGSANPPKKKKRKTEDAKKSFIEDEASESDDGEALSENDEEDGEDTNEYKKDGFVVDDAEEGEADDKRRRKKKKKEKNLKRLKQRDDAELDEEDIRLMQENLGMTTTKEMSDESDDEEELKPKVKKKNDKALTRQMFGDSDDEEDEPSRKPNRFLGDEAEYESDDMDEFIVDEDDGSGQPRRRRKTPGSMTMVGPSAYQMDEAEELFGDVEGFLKVTQGTAPDKEEEDEASSEEEQGRMKTKRLLGQYEPSVLTEHMMTQRDIQIGKKDVPERYQFAYDRRTIPSPEERSEEAEWICEYIFPTTNPEPILPDGSRGIRKRGEISGAIDSVLRFYHEEKLEIAYVRRYCKEFWKYAGLRGHHLSEIADLDEKWDKLERKKKSLRRMLKRSIDSSEDSIVGTLSDSFYEMSIKAANENQVRDFAEFIAMDSGDEKVTSGLRRPVKRGFYRTCRKANLQQLTRKFVMPVRTLGNILLGTESPSADLVPTPEEDPEMFALGFVRSEFPLVTDALKGARHIAASEIAAEPNVRQTIRELYRQRGVIYTEATVKGQDDIDEFHYCHGCQYLVGQPIMELYKNETYLRIARGEKEGFLTVMFEYEQLDELLNPLKPIYLANDASELWQSQREQILHDAVYNILLPSLEREIRDELLQKARQVVVQQCGAAIRKKLWVRPYQSRDLAESVAIGVWVEEGRDAKVYFVKLDTNGNLVDKLQALVERDETRIMALANALYSFLEQHADTHVVVLNTNGGMKCMDMGQLIDGVRNRLQRNDADRFGNMDGRDYLHVTFVQDDVARIYSRSQRGQVEFPDESEGVRGAISLARYIQNPLSEISAMWETKALDDPSRGADLLSLDVHPLQHFVVKSSLVKEYDRVFCEVINCTGVDINMAVHNRHASYQLQFVAGLGPTKATQLIAAVKRTSHIERRDELVSSGILGKTVYRNAVGFLRIRERDMLKDSALNPLDDTRIHPESYYMAVKMCGDANNKTALDLYDPDQYSYVVEDTMFQSASAIKARMVGQTDKRLTDADLQDPLSELDLAAYASRLEQDQKGLKLLTLESIKKELRYPYFEKRHEYEDPKDEDMLYLLHGETRLTLRLGMIVPCTLQYETRDFVRVRLESGIRSNLRKDLLPDYMDRDYLRYTGIDKGMTVHAKILRVEPDDYGQFGVVVGCDDGSLRNMDMVHPIYEMPSCLNFSKLREDSEKRIEKLLNRPPISQEEIERKTHKSKHRKRQISHPHFKNVDCRGALNILKDQPAGEALFRPSSMGTDHLTLSWKMADKIYRHYDIQEQEKASDRRLGAKLVLKDETYEDLDEVLARYVGPMNDLVEDIMASPKFSVKSRNDVFKDLHELKEKNPKSFPYFMRFSGDHPGCVAISYITNKTVRNAYAQFGPNGMSFYGKFSSRPIAKVNDFLNFFKKSIMKLMSGGNQDRSSKSSRSHRTSSDRHHSSRRQEHRSSRYGR